MDDSNTAVSSEGSPEQPPQAGGVEPGGPEQPENSTGGPVAPAGEDQAEQDGPPPEVRKLRGENQSLRKRLREFEDAQKTEAERLMERAQSAETQLSQLQTDMAAAKVQAAAADSFADPEDASRFLTVSDYLGEDGQFDAEQLRADLGQLLERKPHLAKQDQSQRRVPQPDPYQGSGANGHVHASPQQQFETFLSRRR